MVDDRGEWVSFLVTPGRVDERQELRITAKFIKGKLFGDAGYISKLLAISGGTLGSVHIVDNEVTLQSEIGSLR
jgi:hypothetical protein